jgi:hypothetical protein
MDFAVDLNSSFLNVVLFGRAQPTYAFRVSSSAVEGPKFVGFQQSPEGISRALSESRRFQDENARFVGTSNMAFSESFGASRTFREIGRDKTVAVTFAGDSHFPSGNVAEVMGSEAIWIGAGSALGAILIGIVVIGLFLGCHPRLLKPAGDAMESDIEPIIPADGKVSST